MGQNVTVVPARHENFTVAAGATAYRDITSYGVPLSVSVYPTGGGTMTVSYSTTIGAAALAGSANWQPWPAGSVTAANTQVLLGPVSALCFVAATGPCAVEIVG